MRKHHRGKHRKVRHQKRLYLPEVAGRLVARQRTLHQHVMAEKPQIAQQWPVSKCGDSKDAQTQHQQIRVQSRIVDHAGGQHHRSQIAAQNPQHRRQLRIEEQCHHTGQQRHDCHHPKGHGQIHKPVQPM